jgi:hypothetical protein
VLSLSFMAAAECAGAKHFQVALDPKGAAEVFFVMGWR